MYQIIFYTRNNGNIRALKAIESALPVNFELLFPFQKTLNNAPYYVELKNKEGKVLATYDGIDIENIMESVEMVNQYIGSVKESNLDKKIGALMDEEKYNYKGEGIDKSNERVVNFFGKSKWRLRMLIFSLIIIVLSILMTAVNNFRNGNTVQKITTSIFILLGIMLWFLMNKFFKAVKSKNEINES